MKQIQKRVIIKIMMLIFMTFSGSRFIISMINHSIEIRYMILLIISIFAIMLTDLFFPDKPYWK